MKFCANCGTQMPDESKTCPQCGYSSDASQSQTSINEHSSTNVNQQSKSNKLVKFYIIIPIVIIISIITSLVVSVLVLNSTNKNNSNYTTPSSAEVCPASEYGNHNWDNATCIKPAQCYNCDAYKDNQLGNHHWWVNDYDIKECMYCHMLYDEYVD